MLAAFCASGTELYISAIGSAAAGQQLSEACPSVTALSLPIPLDGDGVEGSAAIVEGIAITMPLVEAPRRTGLVSVEVPNAAGAAARVWLVQLDGLSRLLVFAPRSSF